MAITEIDTVKVSDTFEKQRSQVNLGLTKLNEIDLTEDTLNLEDRAHPVNTAVADGSFTLYMEANTGDLYIAVKKSGDADAKKFRLVDYSATGQTNTISTGTLSGVLTGYTNGATSAVTLTKITGNGTGTVEGTANVSGGSIVSATITNGGFDYAIGDTLTVVDDTLSTGAAVFTVSTISNSANPIYDGVLS